MKKVLFSSLIATLVLFSGSSEAGEYGFVNFKQVVEGSKLGKQEQASFDTLKNQMEKVLEEKDKELSDLATKFNDPDYLDSLSPEAENEIKNKARTLQMDMSEKQSQFYQALQNAQAKIMVKIAEVVSTASKKIAADKKLSGIFNQDATFYFDNTLDYSKDVIKEMDSIFENEATNKTQTPQSLLNK